MTPPEHIRRSVFGLTQEGMAALIGVSQPTWSRWESDGRIPSEHQDKVRVLGRTRRADWQDAWFFDVPEEAQGAAA